MDVSKIKNKDSMIEYRSLLMILSLSLIFLSTSLYAAKPSVNPNCTITAPQNNPVSVTTGGSVIFQGVVSGGTAPYEVSWTFSGGTPNSVIDSGLR